MVQPKINGIFHIPIHKLYGDNKKDFRSVFSDNPVLKKQINHLYYIFSRTAIDHLNAANETNQIYKEYYVGNEAGEIFKAYSYTLTSMVHEDKLVEKNVIAMTYEQALDDTSLGAKEKEKIQAFHEMMNTIRLKNHLDNKLNTQPVQAKRKI